MQPAPCALIMTALTTHFACTPSMKPYGLFFVFSVHTLRAALPLKQLSSLGEFSALNHTREDKPPTQIYPLYIRCTRSARRKKRALVHFFQEIEEVCLAINPQ